MWEVLRREYGVTRDEFLWGDTFKGHMRFLEARNRYIEEYNKAMDSDNTGPKGEGRKYTTLHNTGGDEMISFEEAERMLNEARPVTMTDLQSLGLSRG